MPVVAMIVLLTVILGVLGCVGSGEQVGSPAATATPVLELDVPPEVENQLAAIRDSVLARAAEIGEDVDASDLDVLDITRREWPTAAMGCPDPDRSYAQVVTTGYSLQVDAGETIYEVHVSDDGNLIVCEPLGQTGAPTVGPDAAPAAAPAVDVEQFVEQARDALERQFEQAREADVLDIQRMEWPSAAMGCPEPGQSYAQVVTQGYAISFSAADTRYEVHVSESGRMVVCGDGGQPQGGEAPDRSDLVRAAVTQDLASRLNVAPDEVRVVEFQAVEWRDSSLGCPGPGRMYLQVITPGYRVVVEGPEAAYEYHTDRSGDRVVLCQQPSGERRQLGSTEAREVAERARQTLASRLDIDSSTISVVELVPLALLSEPVPCPGADTLTGDGPAYHIRLEADQQTYVYRVRGDQLLLCSQ